ncbi:accessory factor UbiK family protein [Paracraurococcus ruber]|uniref:accessory factor UbiK family protein n=1 Tax=Paracraurococcus ruber TaxID=77675 RepID=UPI0030B90939
MPGHPGAAGRQLARRPGAFRGARRSGGSPRHLRSACQAGGTVPRPPAPAGRPGGEPSIRHPGRPRRGPPLAPPRLAAAVQRLDLVKREDLDAAMELARRAREAQEALETRVAALEARIATLYAAAPAATPPVTPGERTEAMPDGV